MIRKSYYELDPLQLSGLTTYPLDSRDSLVDVNSFGSPLKREASFQDFLDSLPQILAGKDLKEFIARIHMAKKKRRNIVWGIGGHVIKVGLGPILADLIKRGYVSGIAMNGAAMIHDFEIALVGKTSEDVAEALPTGKFGMAEETGKFLNQAASLGVSIGIGYGEAVGKFLSARCGYSRNTKASVLWNAYKHRIPVTVHLAIGTDITHLHPLVDGRTLGEVTYTDFKLFCALVKGMDDGGAYLNWGSAVILPEIFLKAISAVRNLGTGMHSITTANFDFIQHYRPLQNVVRRPLLPSSKGYAFTGHHEIMLPLVVAGLGR